MCCKQERGLVCADLYLSASIQEIKSRLNDCNDLCWKSAGKKVIFLWMKHTESMLQEDERIVGTCEGSLSPLAVGI